MHQHDHDRWQPGTAIVQEEYWRHQLVTVRLVTVVEDTPEILALYSHAGSTYRSGAMRNRQQIPLAKRLRVYLSDEQPVLVDRRGHANLLTLNPPDAGHAIWLFWDRDWNFLRWYVNLQTPFRRTPQGIVVGDYLLDLVVTPKLAWSWKDEDEFEAVCAAGVFTEEERQRIRAEGIEMAKRIESRRWPFNEDWPRWRPDTSWPVPSIPDDWRPHGPHTIEHLGSAIL